MENILKQIYYNPSQGFMSADKLYRKAKAVNPEIKYKDITDFLSEQYTWQINKQARKPRKYRTIVASYPRECYQMDIIVYDRYEINKYKYILCCIDVYSRYATCVPLTNMEARNLLQAIKVIFSVMGKPKKLNMDQQFSSPKLLLDYFSVQGITLYASETDELYKNAIVERFNRTLAGMLQKWRLSQKDRRWYLVLPKIVESYNNNYHSTIKATPKEVWDRKVANRQSPIHRFAPEFKVGDKVRARYEKRTFDKGDLIKYTEDIYLITDKPKPHRYTLQNLRTGVILKKAHKDEELMLVDSPIDLPPSYQEHSPTVYQNTRARSRPEPRQTRLQTGAIERRVW